MAENVIGEALVLIRPLAKHFARDVEKQTGPALDKAAADTEKKVSAGLNKVVALSGAAITGLGAVLTKYGRDLQRSQIGLQTVIENSGRSFADYTQQIDAATKAQARYGHSSADVRNALTKLTLATKDPTTAIKALEVTADLAALKNISLADAATLVGRAYGGNAKLLRQFGIDGIRAAETAKELKDATASHSKAVERLNGAQRNLRDLEESIAERRRKSSIDLRRERDARKALERVQVRGAESVADAQENLADLQAELAGQTEIELSDQIRLREAQQSVLRAQASAVEDLADAEQDLSDIEADYRERQKLSVSEAHSLRDARQEVSEAQAEQARTANDVAVAQKASTDAAAAGAANLAALAEKIGGIAAQQSTTLIGKLEGIKTALGNMVAELGERAGPAVAGFGTLLTGAGGLGSALSGVESIVSLKLLPKLGSLAAALVGPVGLAAAAVVVGAALGKFLAENEAFNEWIDRTIAGLKEATRSFLEFIGVRDTESERLAADAERRRKGALEANPNYDYGYGPGVAPPAPVPGRRKRHSGGLIPAFASGGEVPILAQPGEFVMRRRAVNQMGLAGMHAINSGRGGRQTIVVPLIINGREFARATVDPMRAELNKVGQYTPIFGGRG